MIFFWFETEKIVLCLKKEIYIVTYETWPLSFKTAQMPVSNRDNKFSVGSGVPDEWLVIKLRETGKE